MGPLINYKRLAPSKSRLIEPSRASIVYFLCLSKTFWKYIVKIIANKLNIKQNSLDKGNKRSEQLTLKAGHEVFFSFFNRFRPYSCAMDL